MKLTKKDLFFIGLSAVSLAAHACLMTKMPDTVPTHWSFDGTVNGYSSKYTTLLIAAFPLLMIFLMKVMPHIDPRKKSYALHKKAYDIFIYVLTIFLIACDWAMNAAIFGLPVRIEQVIPWGVGILFVIIGNYMPQLRPNYFMGIRTPWALENEHVWKKTHSMGGIVFCLMGLLLIAAGFFSSEIMIGVLTFGILGGCVWLYVYSWLVYRKLMRDGH